MASWQALAPGSGSHSGEVPSNLDYLTGRVRHCVNGMRPGGQKSLGPA